MKQKLIFIFFINLLLGSSLSVFAQNRTEVVAENDSVYYKERYGLRIGLDLSKPGRSLLDSKYTGMEIKGDYRLNKRLYPAAEIGHEGLEFEENYFSAKSRGSYLKLGINYNAYENWIGMQNEIYIGFRYGISTFKQTLLAYTYYNKDYYFPPDTYEDSQSWSGLSTHWIELQLGLKTEVLHNLFLGIHVEMKRIINDNPPDNFENLWIPGYNRHYTNSEFGVGWGYSISYLLPIRKKERKEGRK